MLECDLLSVHTAAEQACATAQGNLGYVFERGLGVPVDYPEAYKWYQLASRRGLREAKRALYVLRAIMTPKQLREGETRASSWQVSTTFPNR